jgi:signal transduction histidine kinase
LKWVEKIMSSPFSDRIDGLRYNAFIGYLVFQFAQAVFLLLYGIARPELFDLLVPAALYTFPTILLAVFFARRNFRITAKVYAFLSYIVQCIYLFKIRFSVEMNLTSLVVFVMISILAFAVINKSWGLSFFALGLGAILCNYALADADFRSDIRTYDINGIFYHTAGYTIFMFCFICYLLFLFEKYMRLYLSENTTSNDLNAKLKVSVSLLNAVNADLEKNVAALSDANIKLTNYAWAHAHEVRAPLARILGLINLVKVDRDLDKDFFTITLLNTAQELDAVITKMNRVLEEVNIEGDKGEKENP